MRTVVLLSGGMDSTIALFWTLYNRSGPVDVLTIDYGQRHAEEVKCAHKVWGAARKLVWGKDTTAYLGSFKFIQVNHDLFAGQSSILGTKIPVAQYHDVQDAAQHNQSDSSYIPLRNAIFVSIAANHLLTASPSGGTIITGFRGRVGEGGGFQDGTPQFSDALSRALSLGAGKDITVLDPLNRPGRSRLDALRLAETLPGCFAALGFSMSCFNGTEPPCGHCLPCLRRAQGFVEYGSEDPLLVRLHAEAEVD